MIANVTTAENVDQESTYLKATLDEGFSFRRTKGAGVAATDVVVTVDDLATLESRVLDDLD